MTQKLMRQERGLSAKSDLPNRRLCLKHLRMNWISRKLYKMDKIKRETEQSKQEIQNYGMSMLGARVNGQFVWR
jgi:hypothetical protein